MADTLLTSDRLSPDKYEGPLEEVDDLENGTRFAACRWYTVEVSSSSSKVNVGHVIRLAARLLLASLFTASPPKGLMDLAKAGCLLSRFLMRAAMLILDFNTSCTRLVKLRIEASAQSIEVLDRNGH